ncbi:hypothetical protein [Bifidobacterium sp. ESL0745]|uniref:hypothetical protein n=1 Tax=Bifidobacterium sp. ESL0745 TaxID=2983226 RepID=UPI0023F62A31|nr:hypothetical protein [Bifidobacterium sp. ESL0745]MDF7664746.1 hypothetical protein [Bifidobacterium sp. ESL0745]
MLATNNHINTGHPELRMDFVLRVARGQVNPTTPATCTTGTSPSGRSRGFKLFYQAGANTSDDLDQLGHIYALGDGLLGLPVRWLGQ